MFQLFRVIKSIFHGVSLAIQDEIAEIAYERSKARFDRDNSEF